MKLSVEGKAVGSLSKSDASIDPRILDSARREFLARGFEGASLQSICADAGVTTGALYKRYKGKADLFEAVVAPTLADIRALEEEAKRRDYALMDDKNLRELWALSEDIHRQWMIYFYERYEGMRLLLCCAEDTAYANFLHDFVARNLVLHPGRSLEYVLVPLIIRTIKIADDLAASAMTRGLDLVGARTTYRDVRIGASGALVTAAVLVCTAAGYVAWAVNVL